MKGSTLCFENAIPDQVQKPADNEVKEKGDRRQETAMKAVGAVSPFPTADKQFISLQEYKKMYLTSCVRHFTTRFSKALTSSYPRPLKTIPRCNGFKDANVVLFNIYLDL
ncbi:MAG TPA: hypothetical protein VFG54_02110 [Prolixibacteraceae bacterium]|nr:hypothetical protein [Prolixibacteraceae bacterium]